MGREVRERRLEERLPGGGNRPPLPELVRLLLGERVAESVAELLLRERDGTVSVRGIAQCDRRDTQRGRRQEQHAFRRCWVDRHRGRCGAVGQETLRDQSPKGMADDDRLATEL